jgi:serine/threonine protein kinase
MIGKQIQNYRIERLIGEGGMGNVYLGVHTLIGRKVAIKALNPGLAKNPEIRERFKNEASMLSQLHHPNIVQLYDYVEMDDGIFLVMEYAEGQPLDEYIEKVTGPIPEEKALPLFAKILDGVAYAHKKNVVHRDIKPSNIIVNAEGKVKILDFGIAKIIGDSNHKLTKTGTKLGTVLYMSPEQVKGQGLDLRTDIYSLGITLFEIVTGRCPFDSNSTEYEVYKKIVEEPLPDARNFYPALSAHCAQVIFKATEKDPANRFQTCAEFKNFLLNPPAETIPAGKKKRVKKEAKKAETPVNPGLNAAVKKPRKSLLFWNLFMGGILILALAVSIYKLLYIKDDRYVIASRLYLRSSKSISDKSNSIKVINFGSTVEILDEDRREDEDGLTWAKVRDESGKEGYVAMNYLGTRREFEQIRGIFLGESQDQTLVQFKKAVQEYFSEKSYFDNDGNPEWKLSPEGEGSVYNCFAIGDFNKDGLDDYACVITNKLYESWRLLVFEAKGNNATELILDEEIFYQGLLGVMRKGEKISTGRVKTVMENDEFGNVVQTQKKIYESLASDALILKDKESGKRMLYIYNLSEASFNQPIEMK